jgi:hypothetical protein
MLKNTEVNDSIMDYNTISGADYQYISINAES